MDNFSNIDKQKLQQMLNSAAAKQGMNGDKLSSAVSGGDLNALMGSLNQSQAQNLQKVLNDKKALEALLNSPAAKKLFGNLSK